MSKMYYINYKPTKYSRWAKLVMNEIRNKKNLTVDSYETYEEAKENLDLYFAGDPAGDYWISARACKKWAGDTK